MVSAMDVARPYAALVPTLDGDVVTVLAGTTRPLTGREVARLTGRRAHSGVLEVLGRLTEQGLVDRQEAGRALLYTLNRDHLAAPAAAVLADMRPELYRRMARTIEEWPVPAVHASVFGSTARGDGDAASDIDLLILRSQEVSAEDEAWRTQIDDLAARIRRWTGNRASIAEVGESELCELAQTERPIIRDLHKDAIRLVGPVTDTTNGALA